MTSRRDFLKSGITASVALLAGACGGTGATQPTATAGATGTTAAKTPAPLKPVRLGVQGAFLNLAAPFIAKRKGYFEEMGVQVNDLKTIQTGAVALVGGELDFFCAGGTDIMLLADKGERALAIAGLVKGVQLHLEVHPDVLQKRGVTTTDPLAKRLAAIKGLTIATSGPGSAPDAVLDLMVKQAGLRPTDVTRQTIFGQPLQQAALEQHQVDGIIGGSPLTELLVQQKLGAILINGPELGDLTDVVYEAAYGMKAWVDTHPDETLGVAKALAKANAFIANDATAAQFLNQTDFNGFSVEILTASLVRFRSAVYKDGKATKGDWEATMKYAMNAGLLRTAIDMNEGGYWTNKFLG